MLYGSDVGSSTKLKYAELKVYVHYLFMTIVFGLARLNLPLFLLDKISRCNRANGYAEFKFFPHVAATRGVFLCLC